MRIRWASLASALLLLVMSTSAFAAPPAYVPTQPGVQVISEVYSEMENQNGTSWTWESGPQALNRTQGRRDVGTDGVGLWWGGYYVDKVDNTFVANAVQTGPKIEFLRLGKGICEARERTVEMEGKVDLTGGGTLKGAINLSFGFSASGKKTFKVTQTFCGPDGDSAASTRIFYRQLIYNQYDSHAERWFFTPSGILLWIDKADATALVPHMALLSEDI